jgi:hypothetical protein
MRKVSRYDFAPYRKNSKTTCPQCGKEKVLRRFIDVTTNNYLPDHVGICDREEKCGYKYTWWDWVRDESKDVHFFTDNFVKVEVSEKYSVIPTNLLERSRTPSKKYRDELSQFLLNVTLFKLTSAEMIGVFGIDTQRVKSVLDMYKIGFAKTWGNKKCTIFWQIDQDNNVRTGKIMAYEKRGSDIKRVKGRGADSKPLINWIHSYYKLREEFILKQCFFGEHLLKEYPDKKVVIVEGEKTAIISAIFYPEYLWLSSGMLRGINEDKMLPLKGREIVLSPDKGAKAFKIWENNAKEFKKKGYNIKISRILETKKELGDGDDIADWILKMIDFVG